jgi:hypothetical protein
LNEEEKLQSLQTNVITLDRHGLILYYPDKGLEKIAWLNIEALVEYIQNEVLSKKIIKNEKPGIVAKEAFEKLTDEKTLRLLIKQKVLFLHKPSEIKPELDEYIIPNYLPLTNQNDPEYQLFIFGMLNPSFIIKFDDFIPFGFINRMICFYGQEPDVKKFWRNQLLFTLQKDARILIQLDFEQLKIKVHFQMLSAATEKFIEEYLFFSIMALYRDYGSESIFTYKEFTDYKNGSIIEEEGIVNKNSKSNIWFDFQNNIECVPSDVYISLDNVRFISYRDLFQLESTQYKIKSFSIEVGRINKTEVKEILVSPFSAFTTQKLPAMKKVFISYSHDDIQYRQEMQKYLVNLERDGLIEIWQDGLIQAGEDWDKKIKAGLENADLSIMLLSQSFITSNYIHEVEFRKIMEKRMNGNSRILPVLVKACDWKNWKVYPKDVLAELNEENSKDYKIGTFQFLPIDDEKRVKPLNKWSFPEDAWLQVSDSIKSFCNQSHNYYRGLTGGHSA